MVRFDQGWLYLAETASTYQLPAFLLGAVFLAALARRRGGWSAGEGGTPLRAGERLAMLAIAGAVAAYAARVGGSHVHYWYLAFPFSLAVCSTAGIVEEAFARLGLSKFPVVGWAAMLGLSLLVFWQYPPQLSAHPFRGDAEHEPVHFIDDALLAPATREPPGRASGGARLDRGSGAGGSGDRDPRHPRHPRRGPGAGDSTPRIVCDSFTASA